MNLNTLSDPLIICPKWKHFLWCCHPHWSPVIQMTQTPISRNGEKCLSHSVLENIPDYSIANHINQSHQPNDGIQDIMCHCGHSGCAECLIIVAPSGLCSALSAGCILASIALLTANTSPGTRPLSCREETDGKPRTALRQALTWYSLGDRPRAFVSRKVCRKPSCLHEPGTLYLNIINRQGSFLSVVRPSKSKQSTNNKEPLTIKWMLVVNLITTHNFEGHRISTQKS